LPRSAAANRSPWTEGSPKPHGKKALVRARVIRRRRTFWKALRDWGARLDHRDRRWSSLRPQVEYMTSTFHDAETDLRPIATWDRRVRGIVGGGPTRRTHCPKEISRRRIPEIDFVRIGRPSFDGLPGPWDATSHWALYDGATGRALNGRPNVRMWLAKIGLASRGSSSLRIGVRFHAQSPISFLPSRNFPSNSAFLTLLGAGQRRLASTGRMYRKALR